MPGNLEWDAHVLEPRTGIVARRAREPESPAHAHVVATRVVAGRKPIPLLRTVDNRGVEFRHDEAVDRVDILAASGPEAEVVEPRPVLVEPAVPLTP